jgi:hypothetical protein
VERTQISVPDGTVAPLAIGFVAAESENISPPVARTVAGGALRRRWPGLLLVLTVKGPSTLPAGPLTDGGVMVRLGFDGSISGPASWMCFTMAATVLCSGSAVLSTYLSVKYQMAACTAAAVWLVLAGVKTGWVVLG